MIIQKHKFERKIKVNIFSITVVSIIAILLMSSCNGNNNSINDGYKTEDTKVKFEVTGEGVNRITVSWGDDKGVSNDGYFTVPFTKQFSGFLIGDTLRFSAAVLDPISESNWIKCRIYDGEKLVAEDTSSTLVLCDAIKSKAYEINPNSNEQPRISEPTSAEVQSKEEWLMMMLHAVVNGEDYDSTGMVLHKFIESINVDITNNILTFIVTADIETTDDFIGLAGDLISIGAFFSDPGKESDWKLTKIEVVSPGLSESYASIFVSSHEAIEAIANDYTTVFGYMQTEINYGTEPTQSNLGNSTPCSCSANLYNCDDFDSRADAIACYDYCYPSVGDIHWLDDDKDLNPCEPFP